MSVPGGSGPGGAWYWRGDHEELPSDHLRLHEVNGAVSTEWSDEATALHVDLRRRIVEYRNTADRRLVLDDGATAMAEKLFVVADQGFSAGDVNAVHLTTALADLHWLRFSARGVRLEGEDAVPLEIITFEGGEGFALAFESGGDADAAADIARAVTLYAIVQPIVPDAVPAAIANHCETLRTGRELMTRMAEQRADELLRRFDTTGDITFALEAAAMLSRAARYPVGTPEGVQRLLVRLGATLVEVYAATSSEQYLDGAERAIRTALTASERTGIPRADALIHLGQILLTRAMNGLGTSAGHDSLAEAAVGTLRRALELAGDGEREFARASLAAAMLHTASPDDLGVVDEAIGMLRTVLADGSRNTAYYGGAQANLATALQLRQRITGEPGGDDEARELLGSAVRLLPSHHAQRAVMAAQLGDLAIRAPDPTVVTALDEAIEALTAATAHLSLDSGVRVAFARQLYARYLIRGGTDDLRRAVEMMRAIVDDVDAPRADRIAWNDLLNEMLSSWYLDSADTEAMAEALRRTQNLVAGQPDDSHLLWQLGRLLAQDFWISRRKSVIDEAVVVLGRALDRTDAADPGYDKRLQELASAVLVRAEHVGGTDGVDDVLSSVRARVEADAARALTYGNVLARAHLHEWEHSTEGRLESAIAAARDSLRNSGVDWLDRATGLTMLGNLLREQFGITGDLGHLNEAIDVSRQAVTCLPSRHPDVQTCAGNLATALQVRYIYTDDTAALDEAIASARLAESVSPLWGHDDSILMATLGGCLLARGERAGSVEDLREAVSALRRSVQATPLGHPRRARHLTNLAAGLHALGRLDKDPVIADEALAVAADAVAATPATSPVRGVSLHNLAAHHLERQTDADVTTGIALLREALGASRSGAHSAMTASALGHALTEQFERTGDAAVADEGSLLLRSASDQPNAPARIRIDAALRLGRFGALRDDADLALDGYGRAVELLELVAWRGLGRRDRERLLQQYQGATSRAMAFAVHTGRPERAVELLERGRAVLLRQAASGRSRYDDMSVAAPEVTARLAQVQAMLETDPAAASTDENIGPAGRMEVRDRLVREWEQLVDDVRQLPGFADFLAPPSFENLRPAPGDPPIVIVNVDELRSDALIVDSAGVTTVPLPGVRRAELQFCAVMWEAALGRMLHNRPRSRLPQLLRMRGSVDWALRWLWNEIAAPVLAALGIDGPPDGPWPRVRWCPVGYVRFLPLHAAGHHDVPGKSVLDRVVSSYVTTLHDLYPGWQAGAVDRTPLLVAMANTPERRALDGVDREVSAFADHFPTGRRLCDAHATRAAVLAAIRDCAWAHFACHAEAVMTDPSAARLLLHDGPATVAELRSVQADQGRGALALLLACETVRTAGSLTEEGISLASAMQIVGFRNVIGTMWTIDDEAAADAAVTLYEQLAGAGELTSTAVALALHHTVRQARVAYPHAPLRWAGLVHVGDR